ncbi:signal peptidase I [Arsenophonus symbiont of Ornithomya chloropus]|uniref:signal peptidase I n=1 Tax=Arsenophonus symbiont of Ornithomya chloropus TaxID=634121 RepID=UPI0032B114B0
MANTFSLILTFATLITGIIWIINRFKLVIFFQKKNIKKINTFEKALEQNCLIKNSNQILWINSFSSLFPILAIVLIIRTLIYEPFQIPSGSMMPTLLVGDFILTEKFAYGLKDPITQTTFLKVGKPKRGDIAVFKYPKDSSINFIKRVIGLPGDKIIYDPVTKELTIYPNCLSVICRKKIPIIYSSFEKSEWVLFFDIHSSMVSTQVGSYQIPIIESVPYNALRQFKRKEILDGINYDLLFIPQIYVNSNYKQFGLPDNQWIVPPYHYFMMGDNRDNSADSRMWGFVPEENFIGRAFFIWLSFDKHENKWPTGLRLNRIGIIK